MGIRGHRFYFKQELPKVDEIKKKFHEITGLRLRFYSVAHVDELMTDADDILYHLNKRREETSDVVINAPHFACGDFEDVYLDDYMRPETRSFYLKCGIGMESLYFFDALIKTMLEIGGHTFRYSYYPHEEDLDIDNYLEPYNPHERQWKRIKKWDEMCDVEKACFKDPYN